MGELKNKHRADIKHEMNFLPYLKMLRSDSSGCWGHFCFFFFGGVIFEGGSPGHSVIIVESKGAAAVSRVFGEINTFN